MSNYKELLKSPKWQKKRLEVLERENFTCENCGDTESTLHIHHTYYEKGYKPWEYAIDSLQCLCEDCHETVANAKKKMISAINYHGIQTLSYYEEIEGLVYGMILQDDRFEVNLSCEHLTPQHCRGIAKYWGLKDDDVERLTWEKTEIEGGDLVGLGMEKLLGIKES